MIRVILPRRVFPPILYLGNNDILFFWILIIIYCVMILFSIGVIVLQYVNYSLTWINITPEFFIIQTLITYFILRLFFIKNNYQLVGYATLVLLLLGAYLFLLQYDVFACFVLVSESVVMLFVLSILMHLNYTNITEMSRTKGIFAGLIPGIVFAGNVYKQGYNYWVDWFSCQISQYNDLLPQYIYFYLSDSAVVLLVGVWLLLLTFLLVHLILQISLSKATTSDSAVYFRKTQSMWSQWYKKPVIRFFKK